MLSRCNRRLSPVEIIHKLSQRHAPHVDDFVRNAVPTPMVIQQMIQRNALARADSQHQLWRMGKDTRHEVLIRIAHSLRTFDDAPKHLKASDHFKWIEANTWEWFDTLFRARVLSHATHDEMMNAVQDFEEKERPILPDLAVSLARVNQAHFSPVEAVHLDRFLHCFCLSRIGWRLMLLNHCSVAVHGTGAFAEALEPLPIVTDCFQRVRDICLDRYGVKPPFEVHGGEGIHFAYPTAHFMYTVSELIKNSTRATVERHRAASKPLPSMVARLDADDSRVTFHLSDEGGGVPRENEAQVWRFGWSSYKDPLDEAVDRHVPHEDRLLAGWGCGLSLSRCYVNHFGGHIRLHSMYDHGAEVFVELPRFGEETILLRPIAESEPRPLEQPAPPPGK